MRKFLILLGLISLASCKPEVYLGPLDSPIGNWWGVESRYYFNGDYVYEAPGCTYSAISFYKDSLCCIEGVKGAFQWSYSSDSLIVDTTVWRVSELSGRVMNLEYLGVIQQGEKDNDVNIENGNIKTYEYKETIIYCDSLKYWYNDADGLAVACFPVIGKAKDGSDSTICWWNTRSDTYNPF